MADNTFKELKYDGHRVIVEVARRDISNREIPKQYLPHEIIPIDFRSEISISGPYASHTVSANFSRLVDAANNLYTSMATTSESYMVHTHIIFQNLAIDGSHTTIYVNGAMIFYASGDWSNIEVDIYPNNSESYPVVNAFIKIYNGSTIRSSTNTVPINSNTLQIKVGTLTSASGSNTNAHVAMSCRCSIERVVVIS